jgi:hypothetical protein
VGQPVMSVMPDAIAVAGSSIETLDDLRRHLQWAIELEHSTIPPYLCALYSLSGTGNEEASALLAGVLVEEMLHLGLAANILNAVGGRPRLDSPALLPPYPRTLPHCDGTISLDLAPFDAQTLEAFLRVEKPAVPISPAEADGYETIGQFYTALEDGMCELCTRFGESVVFTGDPARQVTDAQFRYTGGRTIMVTSLATALEALAEIVDQGEGVGRGLVWDGDRDVVRPDRPEVAHYYRLQEMKAGRRYQCGDTPMSGPTGEPTSLELAAVLPMRRNPRLDDHPVGHPIRLAQESFNVNYCTMLSVLEKAFNGGPSLLGEAIGLMYGLKAKAQALMTMPDGDGCVAGPTFDYVPQAERLQPQPL